MVCPEGLAGCTYGRCVCGPEAKPGAQVTGEFGREQGLPAMPAGPEPRPAGGPPHGQAAGRQVDIRVLGDQECQ